MAECLLVELIKKLALFNNHSYYDSSKQEIIFSVRKPRTYPCFEKYLNQITIYQFWSCKTEIKLKIYGKNKEYISPLLSFINSNSQLNIIVNDFVTLIKLKMLRKIFNCQINNRKIPTRVNHQLIYSDKDKLNC